ncbi:SDR family NAD(P)-dependent oxidoreductase [Chloroflexota bacterium]
MKILNGKVAIITGSGTGIGRAIAIAMARENAKVVTNNRQPREHGDAESTANEIIGLGGEAVPYYGDVSDFEIAAKLIQTAIDHFGRLDILVNNAGGEDKRRMPWDMTAEDWERTIRTHLNGTFYCLRHACGTMREQGWGRIINTTSRAWLQTVERASYAAAMAGVVGLTRAVARDMGRYGVTCNAYTPFAKTRRTGQETLSKIKRGFDAGVITKQRYEMYANIPEPETVVPLVVYLSSDEAADINGQVFSVNAGRISIYSEPTEQKVIYKKEGLWEIEELINLVPGVLLAGYHNPAPRQP